jgi:hypothetical protein
MAKFDETNNCKENQLIPSFTPNNEVQIWNSDNINNGIKYEFFLSDLFYYLKFSKKRLGIFIASLITIKILIYYYNAKLWLYFNEKESILPISMAKNTKYYITACIVNMEPIIVDYLIEMVKLINYLGEKNIIVSIVENGDSKDKTRDYLDDFRQYLNSKHIPNKFVLRHETEDPRKTAVNITKRMKKYLRIDYLATLRNRCFDFLIGFL